MNKVRWGILSTAKIGREKVIPAIQAGEFCEVIAIASRNEVQAKTEASRLDIPKYYGSYEELLKDTEIDAIYIPLPNNLHVEWAIKAIEANKHVLCEKPIGVSAAEAKKLFMVSKARPDLKVMEAFMYRFHPQWQYVKKAVDDGKIGKLKIIQSSFSYYNIDPNNIRNRIDVAGGALMDIGCYCVSLARYLFNDEPKKVIGVVERGDPFKTDILTRGILEFAEGSSIFSCSTQLVPYQRVTVLGTEARIEIEIPFNPTPDSSTTVWLYTKTGSEKIEFPPVNQYTIQADLFSQAILNNTDVPTPLIDAVNNMKVIEAVFESAANNVWKEL